jgi:hypothetical protein
MVEPALRQAAVLLTHWASRDIEAVTILLADIEEETARDTILALLILRKSTPEEIARLVRTTLWEVGQ